MGASGYLLLPVAQWLITLDELLRDLAELENYYPLVAAYERLDRWKRKAFREMLQMCPEEATVLERKSRSFAISDSEEIFQNEIELLTAFLTGFRDEVRSLESKPLPSDRRAQDVAQICLAGHVANSRFRDYPEHNKEFCQLCGSKTVSTCQKCQHAIPGSFPDVVSMGNDPPPKFCVHCGSPYPWTSTALEAALEAADEAENLSPEQREQLKLGIQDLVQESPKTPLAIMRVKKLLAAAGTGVAEATKKTLIDVISEVVKRQLFGP
jgi:hypothetical protein